MMIYIMGISYTVSDDLSISYGVEEIDGTGGKTLTKKLTGFCFLHNGGMTLSC